jgi:hypothetical protein
LDEYGSTDLALLDSGTSALRLALEGSVAQTGSDVVALPGFCCFDVATAAVGAGARVAIYDLNPETLGPDFDSLRDALRAGARTVVVAHLYGFPVDLDRSREMANEYDAILIEDAAQGAGGAWRDMPLGSWGDLGILSFGRGKGRTGGSGGALLANSEIGSTILRELPKASPARSRGILKIAKLAAQWAFGRPSLYAIPAALPFLRLGETRFKQPWLPGGMAPAPAAALLANWRASKREEQTRRLRAMALTRRRRDQPVLPLGIDDKICRPGWLRLPATQSDLPLAQSARRRGVEESYPSTLYEVIGNPIQPHSAADLVGARMLASNLVTFPIHRWCSYIDE